jgi:hypothetical protein
MIFRFDIQEERVMTLISRIRYLLSFFGLLAISFWPVQAQVSSPNNGPGTRAAVPVPVKAMMKNVDFRLTDEIVVHIASLRGELIADHGDMPVFDDKSSFHLDIESGTMVISTTALTNDMNDFVFARPDAPFKKLSVTTQGNQLVLKGILASKGGIPFETAGIPTVTPDGLIRVHTTKMTALHLPIKGLMDLVGLDTADMINTKKIKGVTIDKDDLILDPQEVLPPPQMRGHLSSLQVESGGVTLVFASQNPKGDSAAIISTCGGHNFQSYKGGSIRFGKLTMTDADLELVDSSPADSFDFSIDHYMKQLAAGYSKITSHQGLCVYMPDFNKVKPAVPAKQ